MTGISTGNAPYNILRIRGRGFDLETFDSQQALARQALFNLNVDLTPQQMLEWLDGIRQEIINHNAD